MCLSRYSSLHLSTYFLRLISLAKRPNANDTELLLLHLRANLNPKGHATPQLNLLHSPLMLKLYRARHVETSSYSCQFISRTVHLHIIYTLALCCLILLEHLSHERIFEHPTKKEFAAIVLELLEQMLQYWEISEVFCMWIEWLCRGLRA